MSAQNLEKEKIKILISIDNSLKNIWKTKMNRVGTTTIAVQMRNRKDAFSKLLNIENRQLEESKKINKNIGKLLKEIKSLKTEEVIEG